MSTDIMLSNVRMSFPRLFTPAEFKTGDGKPRWSASFLIEPGSENDKKIRAAIDAEAAETWKAKAKATVAGMQGNSQKMCYINGEDSEGNPKYDGYEGMWSLACHRQLNSKQGEQAPPLVIHRDKSPLTERSGKPYAGCYVNAKVSIYAQGGENPGVRASFSAVQFWADGDAFSSSKPTDAGFEAADVGTDADAFA